MGDAQTAYLGGQLGIQLGAAVIIGNGPSRKGFDLSYIRLPTFGCNALHRTFWPTWLGACDDGMREEILKYGFPKDSFIFQHGYNEEGEWAPNDDQFVVRRAKHFCTGMMMVDLACQLGFRKLYLLGFDMNTTNIYTGTQHYQTRQGHKAQTPPDWLGAWKYIQKTYPCVTMVQVGVSSLGLRRIAFNEFIGLACDVPKLNRSMVKR